METEIYWAVQRLGQKFETLGPVLEIGASRGGKALVNGPAFRGMERHAVNLTEQKQKEGIRFHRANSNDLRALFPEPYFGTVVSNAVLEHDPYFWRSVEEMKRILLPGGHLIVGVPGFVKADGDGEEITVNGAVIAESTSTYRYHMTKDYWRFSPMAMRDVIFDGMEVKAIRAMLQPPRLLGIAQKLAA